MFKFILVMTVVINLFGNDNFNDKYKKCDDESLKKEFGKVEVCLSAISMLNDTLLILKKDEKLSNLYLSAAYIYEAKKDYQNAVKMFQKTIDLNTKYSVLAGINLGDFYYFGQGVNKNYMKSYKLWKQVVERGDWKGQASENLDFLCNKHVWVCK